MLYMCTCVHTYMSLSLSLCIMYIYIYTYTVKRPQLEEAQHTSSQAGNSSKNLEMIRRFAIRILFECSSTLFLFES